jgi:hypothetical protein
MPKKIEKKETRTMFLRCRGCWGNKAGGLGEVCVFIGGAKEIEPCS